MKSLTVLGAALIALGLAMPAATATPQVAPTAGSELVMKVATDCHSAVRRHYLEAYGRKVWHRHRQSNCRVVLADPPQNDEEDGFDQPRDCHRDVQRHYIPEYGRRVTHRHVGPRCRVKEYQRHDDDGGSNRNCIQLGPLTYCEN